MTRTRTALTIATAAALALALSGCNATQAGMPSPTAEEDLYPAESNVETSIMTYFTLLSMNQPDSVAELSLPEVDLESDLAMLLDPAAYLSVEGKPKFVAVDDVTLSSDEDDATATVTYEMNGAEQTEKIELTRIGEYDDKPDDYAVVIPDGLWGIDPTGAELLPAATVYKLGGWDVSAAFRDAIGWAGDGPLPRLPAFGGTYPLEITVPGEGGFTDALELTSSTFYVGDGTDGALEAFARAHGY